MSRWLWRKEAKVASRLCELLVERTCRFVDCLMVSVGDREGCTERSSRFLYNAWRCASSSFFLEEEIRLLGHMRGGCYLRDGLALVLLACHVAFVVKPIKKMSEGQSGCRQR